MRYLATVPDENALRDLYAQYAASFKGYEAGEAPSWAWLTLDAIRDVNIRILRDTGGLRGRSLVEIGASYGHFLLRARRMGARVSAIEVDEGARAHLAALGIEATEALPPGRLHDVACAFQVLEHLADPGRLVAAVASALVSDGRLLLAVPNGGEAEQIGSTWIGFRVDLEHLNYFDVGSLAQLLARHGLYVEQHWVTHQPGLWRASALELSGPIERLLSKAIGSAQAASSGSYVLTVLARKVC